MTDILIVHKGRRRRGDRTLWVEEGRKDSRRVEAYGNVDELNSCIGLAASVCDSRRSYREI